MRKHLWGTTVAEIRRSYLSAVLAFHPDVCGNDPGAAERFREITREYHNASRILAQQPHSSQSEAGGAYSSSSSPLGCVKNRFREDVGNHVSWDDLAHTAKAMSVLHDQALKVASHLSHLLCAIEGDEFIIHGSTDMLQMLQETQRNAAKIVKKVIHKREKKELPSPGRPLLLCGEVIMSTSSPSFHTDFVVKSLDVASLIALETATIELLRLRQEVHFHLRVLSLDCQELAFQMPLCPKRNSLLSMRTMVKALESYVSRVVEKSSSNNRPTSSDLKKDVVLDLQSSIVEGLYIFPREVVKDQEDDVSSVDILRDRHSCSLATARFQVVIRFSSQECEIAALLTLAAEKLAERLKVLHIVQCEVSKIHSSLSTDIQRMFTRVVGLELEDELLFWQRVQQSSLPSLRLVCGLNVRRDFSLGTGREEWWGEGTSGNGDVALLHRDVLHGDPSTMTAWVHHVAACSLVYERTCDVLAKSRIRLRVVRGRGATVDHVYEFVESFKHTTSRTALEAAGVQGIIVGPSRTKFAVLPTGEVSVPWDATMTELSSLVEATATVHRLENQIDSMLPHKQ